MRLAGAATGRRRPEDAQRYYDDARSDFNEVLRVDRHNFTAHHMLGRIGDMTSRFDDAEYHYLQGLA